MMNDEEQDSKTVYSFYRIDFCSKYISFALLELLSTRTFVLLPAQSTWQGQASSSLTMLEMFLFRVLRSYQKHLLAYARFHWRKSYKIQISSFLQGVGLMSTILEPRSRNSSECHSRPNSPKSSLTMMSADMPSLRRLSVGKGQSG